MTTRKVVYACSAIMLTFGGAVAGLSALFCLTTAHAQSRSTANRDAAKDFKDADTRLNRVYTKLSAKLDKKSLAKLKVAQRAWLVFRDAQADLAESVASQGGTYYAPYGYDEERAVQSDARTKDLEQMLKDAQR